MRFSRRRFLQLTTTAAAMATVGVGHVLAADRPVVLGTWGGDSEKILREALAAKAKEKHGIDVVFDVGTPSARKTKLLAQAARPRNSMDIPWLVDTDMFQMKMKNILKDNDPGAIPNYDTIASEFRTDYSVPTCYSALVLVYNKNKVTTPPRSIKDLWRNEYAGKIGFADLSYDKIIPMASVAHGGSTSDYSVGYESLLELKRNGVRVYSSNEAVSAALKSEEVLVALMWKGRAYQWTEAGLPLAFATPSEGAYPTFFVMGATRNTGQPEATNLVLGCSLEPDVQLAIARAIGQMPTVTTARLPADLEERIGFTERDRKNFIPRDYAYAAAKASEISEFWNQKFKG